MFRPLDVATSLAASVARLGGGLSVGPLGKRPKQRLELYEFEACPYCRKVREALSMLDLEATVYPCPKGGPHFRQQVVERGGKAQFPYLVDPNTGRDAVRVGRHRHATCSANTATAACRCSCGSGRSPTSRRSPPARRGPASAAATSPARQPKKPLELWSFEASPFCRLVRERLCALELPYVLHNVAKGSPSRAAFVKRSGKMMVPYLVDPNTGTEMFESADIVAYLDKTYRK